MPPRKPISARAESRSSRGGTQSRSASRARARREEPVEEELDEGTEADAFPDDEDFEARGLEEGDLEPDLDDRDDLAGEQEDEDIYGEDDYPPEDEDYVADEADPGHVVERSKAGGTKVLPPEEADELESPDATHAGPPTSVAVIGGPDSGRAKRFRGVRMVIGRMPGCEFRLTDEAVSRRHLELILGDKGVLLRDLGSGNGTKVNGERVSERVLKHGDEIVIGKTRLRFLDELEAVRRAEQAADEAKAFAEQQAREAEQLDEEVEAAAQVALSSDADPNDPRLRAATETSLPAIEPPPSNKGLRLSSVVAITGWRALSRVQKQGVVIMSLPVVLFLAFGFMRLVWPSGSEDAPRAQMAKQRLKEARAAYEQGKMDQSLALLEKARELSADLKDDGLYETVKSEVDARRSLDEAKTHLDAGRLEDASKALEQFPQKAIPSRIVERNKLYEALDEKRIEALVSLFHRSVEATDVEAVTRAYKQLPPARQNELTPKLHEFLNGLKQKKQEEAAELRRMHEQQRRSREAQRKAELQLAFAAVERDFNAGQYERAVLECDRVIEKNAKDERVIERATRLKKLIPLFARNLEDAQAKFRLNELQASVAPLRRARELFREIDFSGALGTRIDDDLASAALAVADKAMIREDLERAAEHYREALRLSPHEQRAKEGLERLHKRAELLFQEGLDLRARDKRRAVEAFRRVIELTAQGSLLRKKAQDEVALLAP